MYNLNFTIIGTPLSLQAQGINKRRWQNAVKSGAQRELRSIAKLTNDKLCAKIFYFYKDDNDPDLDNILKPILDALIGICYIDDRQIIEIIAKKKPINGLYTGYNEKIYKGIFSKEEFVNIIIYNTEVLMEIDK